LGFAKLIVSYILVHLPCHPDHVTDYKFSNIFKSAKLWSCRSGPFETIFENRIENAIKVENVFEELGLKTKLKTKAKTDPKRLL
jgi:hypothetical protein